MLGNTRVGAATTESESQLEKSLSIGHQARHLPRLSHEVQGQLQEAEILIGLLTEQERSVLRDRQQAASNLRPQASEEIADLVDVSSLPEGILEPSIPGYLRLKEREKVLQICETWKAHDVTLVFPKSIHPKPLTV